MPSSKSKGAPRGMSKPSAAPRRRKAPSAMERNDEDTDGINAPLVNWDLLAQGPYGQDSLLGCLSHREVDSLCGWATHLTSEKRRSRAASDTPAKANPGPASLDGAHPLLGLSDTPLPPSHLHYLTELARNVLVQGQEAHEGSEGKGPSAFEQFDQSALVAVGMLWEEMATAALLPLTSLHAVRCRCLEDVDQDSVPSHPLTRRPVHLPVNPFLDAPRHAAFREWTLPPEEAAERLALAHDSPDLGLSECALPIVRPATRTLLRVNSGSPSAAGLPSSVRCQQELVQAWCRANGLDADFVARNRHLYSILIPQFEEEPRDAV